MIELYLARLQMIKWRRRNYVFIFQNFIHTYIYGAFKAKDVIWLNKYRGLLLIILDALTQAVIAMNVTLLI